MTNIGSKPTDALLTLHYDNGQKSYELQQTIAPGDQMWVNLAQLVRNRVADRNGNTLPVDLNTVTYDVKDLTPAGLGIMMTSLATDVTYGFHSSPPQIECCSYNGIQFSPTDLDVVLDGTENMDVFGFDSCSSQPEPISPFFPSSSWLSKAPSTAAVSYRTAQGVAPGFTTGSATGEVPVAVGLACPLQQFEPTVPINVVQVQITSADLEGNQVEVKLSGPGTASGTLQVIAYGVNNQESVMYNGGAAVGPGSYTVSLNRPYMAADTYSSVEAIWNYDPIPATATLQLSPGWLVLGSVRHSQYNSPYESACTGTPQTAWTFNSSCTFTQVSLKSDFVSQTYINGTGVSQSHGILKYSKSCTNYPQGANSQNSFLTVSSITGACNTTMVGGVSVATYPSPNVGNPYGCGDDILLVTSSNTNEAVKNAADYCPACSGGFNGTNGHIDDYSSSQACSGNAVGDLGNFWTADTH